MTCLCRGESIRRTTRCIPPSMGVYLPLEGEREHLLVETRNKRETPSHHHFFFDLDHVLLLIMFRASFFVSTSPPTHLISIVRNTSGGLSKEFSLISTSTSSFIVLVIKVIASSLFRNSLTRITNTTKLNNTIFQGSSTRNAFSSISPNANHQEDINLVR